MSAIFYQKKMGKGMECNASRILQDKNSGYVPYFKPNWLK